MNLFKKEPKDEIFNLDVDGKQIIWKLKVYHPVLWSVVLKWIAENPKKLGAMAYNPDEGKAIYIRFTPKTERRKIVEFATENECKQFYDVLSSIVKGESKMNIQDGGYIE